MASSIPSIPVMLQHVVVMLFSVIKAQTHMESGADRYICYLRLCHLETWEHRRSLLRVTCV